MAVSAAVADSGVYHSQDRLRIQYPRVFAPLVKPARYKGAHGGRGSGKSHFFASRMIRRCWLEPGLSAVCLREYQTNLDQSVKRLLESKIRLFGLSEQFKITDKKIETPGGGLIIFMGMQNHNADSIKSLEGYDLAWFEEAHAASQHSLDILRPTLRKPGSEYWFSWNPTDPKNAVDNFLRKEKPEDAIVVEANFDSNPFFPPILEKDRQYDLRRNPDRYAHVWLGKYRSMSQARVFHNWRVEDFETPASARLYFGADWGFAKDPTVLIRCWLDRESRRMFVDYEAWEIGCELDATGALFDKVPGSRKWNIVADSARPETISFVRRQGPGGFKIVPAKKGKSSVEDGIEFLQSYDIIVHPRCKHVADELSTYSWKIDPKTNEVLPILEDKNNHLIDALRYALEGERRGSSVINYL